MFEKILQLSRQFLFFKQTPTGWVVRAKGVHPMLDTDFVDANYIDSYYVLSSVESYNFRNKLVHESRIQDEF